MYQLKGRETKTRATKKKYQRGKNDSDDDNKVDDHSTPNDDEIETQSQMHMIMDVPTVPTKPLPTNEITLLSHSDNAISGKHIFIDSNTPSLYFIFLF